MLSFNQSNRSASSHSNSSTAAEPDYYDGSLTIAELVDGVASPAHSQTQKQKQKQPHSFKVGTDYRAPYPASLVECVDYRVPSSPTLVSAFGAVAVVDGAADNAGADYRHPEPVKRGGGSAILNPEPTYITAEEAEMEGEPVYYQASLAGDEEALPPPQKPKYALAWDYATVTQPEWLNAATAPTCADNVWYHGNITREEAEVRLLHARASRSSSDDSNLFLVREKVAGVTFAVSVLSPMPEGGGVGGGANLQSKVETNEITHHLISRAKRTDGTIGSHFLVNSVHRLRECKTLYAVLAELSKPGLPAFASSEKKLPGLPLTECCTRQEGMPVFGASSYKARPRKASGLNGISSPTSRLHQKKHQHRGQLRANPSNAVAAVSG
eukprot:gene4202-8287_t